MFSHIVVGANDIEASKAFYDALLSTLGAKPGFVDPKGNVVYLHAGALLIVAPRHPDRGQAVAALLSQLGYSTARRAAGAKRVEKKGREAKVMALQVALVLIVACARPCLISREKCMKCRCDGRKQLMFS